MLLVPGQRSTVHDENECCVYLSVLPEEQHNAICTKGENKSSNAGRRGNGGNICRRIGILGGMIPRCEKEKRKEGKL